MKILFINPKFNLVSPRNIRARNIISELKQLNTDHAIDVLALDFEDQFKTGEHYNQTEVRISKFSKRVIFKEYYNYKSNIIYRGLGYLLYLWMIDPYELEVFLNRKKIFDFIKSNNYDVIVLSVIPFSWINTIPKEFRHKVVFDIGDPLASNSFFGNFIKRTIMKGVRNVHSFEKRSVKSIKHLIVTNSHTGDYYKSMGIQDKQVSVIGQGYDPKIFFNDYPAPKVKFSESGKIVFSYAGTFYKGLREPDALLKAIKNLDNDRLMFQFIGSPMNFFREHSGKNVCVLPKMNQQKCVAILKESDFLVFIDNNEGMQTPGKIYEMLALKKPILLIYATETSGSYQLLKEYDFVIATLNTKEAISQALEKIDKGVFEFHFEENVSQHAWSNLALSFNNVLIQE